MRSVTDNLTWLRSTTCTGGSCVEIARDGDDYLIRDSKRPDVAPLRFSGEEFSAFVKGAMAGEFDF